MTNISETLAGLNKEIDDIRTRKEPLKFLRKETKGNHTSYSSVSYDKIYEKFPDIPVTIWDLHKKMDEIKNLAEWTEWRKQLDNMMSNFSSRLNDWYDCESYMAWVVRRVKNCLETDLITAYEAYLESNLGELECTLWVYVSEQKENTDLLDKYLKLFQKEKKQIISIEMKKLKEASGFKKEVVSKTRKKVKKSIKDVMDLVFKPSKI